MQLTMPILRGLSMFTLVGQTAFTSLLASFISQALENNDVLEHTPVHGEEFSVRLLLTHRRPGSPVRNIMNAEKAAEELLKLSSQGEARYNPAVRSDAIKGWAVESITFQNRPAAVVRAVWLGEPS